MRVRRPRKATRLGFGPGPPGPATKPRPACVPQVGRACPPLPVAFQAGHFLDAEGTCPSEKVVVRVPIRFCRVRQGPGDLKAEP